jgi:hypothetical protein
MVMMIIVMVMSMMIMVVMMIISMVISMMIMIMVTIFMSGAAASILYIPLDELGGSKVGTYLNPAADNGGADGEDDDDDDGEEEEEGDHQRHHIRSNVIVHRSHQQAGRQCVDRIPCASDHKGRVDD